VAPPQRTGPGYGGSQEQSSVDLGPLEDRYNDFIGRANALDQYWKNMDRSLRDVGGLRSSIKAAQIAMGEHMSTALRALRSGDAARAKRSMDLAEQKMNELERAKE
jgi:hypothetical protein